MGMLNVSNFAAIVNPPRLDPCDAPATASGAGNDIVIEQQMTMTLSTDHRCIDGALGAEFINAISCISKARLML